MTIHIPKISNQYGCIEKPVYLICYMSLVIIILIYSTIPVYEVEGNNIDDKTFLYSTAGIIHYDNFINLISNIDKIRSHCSGDNYCEWRVTERLGAYNNYILYSSIVNIVNYFLTSKTLNETEKISISYSFSFLIQHLLIYLIGFFLILFGTRPTNILMLLFLVAVVVTDKWMMNAKLIYLFKLIPDSLLAFGYTPAIYVSRGVAGLAFMTACAAYIGDRKKILTLIILMLPLIHLGYSFFLCAILFLALLLSFFLEKEKQYKLLLITGGVLGISVVLNFITILPMIGKGSEIIKLPELAHSMLVNMNYTNLFLLVAFFAVSLVSSFFFYKNYHITWPLRITVITFLLQVTLQLLGSYHSSLTGLYGDALANQSISQLYPRLSGAMSIPAQVLTFVQFLLVVFWFFVMVNRSKMNAVFKVLIYLAIPYVCYQVTDMKSFYARSLRNVTYLTSGFRERLKMVNSRIERVPYDLEMGLKKDQYSSYSFEEIKTIGIDKVDPKNEVALSLSVYYFLNNSGAEK